MELWIRSQDKECLMKVNDIVVEQNMVIGYFDKDTEYEYLGQYNSKERALEVLDDIQNFMTIEIHEDNINYEQGDLILKGKIVDSLCKIYQMPKE